MPTEQEKQDNPPMRSTRYQHVQQILDAAATDKTTSYQGYGQFWKLPLADFLRVIIYGIPLIARVPGEQPPIGPVADPSASDATPHACCGGGTGAGASTPAQGETKTGTPHRYPGRGAASGLVKGLKGLYPFDGSQFPRLPWGGKAVAASDIQFIEDWIDDGCPETEAVDATGDPQRLANLAAGLEPHEVSVEDVNVYKGRAGGLKMRQNVEHLTSGELCNLRSAVQELMNLNAWPRDMRSYNAWGQLHGDECPHGWSIFLPWHRLYLWGFEHALQDIVPSVTLPYWDWTKSTPEQISSGYIPEAYRCWVTDAMLSSLSGKVSPGTIGQLRKTEGNNYCSINKFWKATGDIPAAEQPAIIAQLKVVNPLFDDLRYPGEFTRSMESIFHHHYPKPEDIERILAIDNWRDFAGGMDVDQSFGVLDMDPHNTMHIWIGGMPENNPNGGDMLNNLTAAFDPIFWGHHSNIDRLWAVWQTKHPGVNPPDLSDVLPGVDGTVEDSLRTRKLGYEYAADTYVFPTEPTLEMTRFTSGNAGVLTPVLAAHRKAEVRLHAVRQPQQSFLVRVFLNLPEANVNTSVENNDHYAGHFSLFGHGPCIGGPGHCDPRPQPRRKFDKRPPHHNEPWNVRLDVTDTVRKLVAKGAQDLQVNLVPISPGRALSGKLRMDAVSLTFHD